MHFLSFHPFPRLPLELRIEIWKYALPGPRILLVQEQTPKDEYYPDMVVAPGSQVPIYFLTSRFEQEPRGRLFTRNPVPALLQVCRESRQLMQKCGYELTFSSRCAPPLVWFNFDKDILYLRPQVTQLRNTGKNIPQFKTTDLARVTKLALAGAQSYFPAYARSTYTAIKQFSILEELFVVTQDIFNFRPLEDGTGWVMVNPKEIRDEFVAIDCELSPRHGIFKRNIFGALAFPILERHMNDDDYLCYFSRKAQLMESEWVSLQSSEKRIMPSSVFSSTLPKIRFVIMTTEEGEKNLLRWKMGYDFLKPQSEDEEAMNAQRELEPNALFDEEDNGGISENYWPPQIYGHPIPFYTHWYQWALVTPVLE